MAPGCLLCFECLFERCSHGTWSSQALSVQRRSGRREVRPGPGRGATLRLSIPRAALGGSHAGPQRLPRRTVLDQEHVLWPHLTRAQAPLCPPPAPTCLRCSSGQVCTSNATSGRLLPARVHAGGCAPAHVYLWSDPAEGYLLFNLFVEVPSCQRPHLLQAPEWGAWRCVDPRS